MQREILETEADVMTDQRSGMCFVVLNHSGQRKSFLPWPSDHRRAARLADHHVSGATSSPNAPTKISTSCQEWSGPTAEAVFAITEATPEQSSEDQRASAACKIPA